VASANAAGRFDVALIRRDPLDTYWQRASDFSIQEYTNVPFPHPDDVPVGSVTVGGAKVVIPEPSSLGVTGGLLGIVCGWYTLSRGRSRRR
jgi:hypothetical protein